MPTNDFFMDKIIQLMNQPWAIEENYESSFKMALINALRSGNINAFEKKITAETVSSKVCTISAGGVNIVDQYSLESVDIPDDSVALIYVEGCIYPWKSFDLEQKIAKVNGNPRLLGAVLLMNTPGGAIHRVDITSDAIKNSKKPIVGYVTGVCASAGMWLISGADKVFVASQSDRLGSIGVMTTYVNDTKFWEQMGVTQTDLYATISTEKNRESRAMEEGDSSLIVAQLDFVNNLFINTIATNRNVKLDVKNPIFKGAMFNASDAITNGLADEMGTLDEALAYVLTQGLKMQANNM